MSQRETTTGVDGEIRALLRQGEDAKAARMALRALAQVEAAPLTREAWLERLMDELRASFEAQGAPLPVKVRVSVGFPSKRALSKAKRRIGECWSGSCDAQGAPQLFVSPLLEEADAMHVLVHELVHAAVGNEAGHKGAFARVARALGLVGAMTATTAGPELTKRLAELAAKIGPYPHAKLDPKFLEKTKQKCRQMKLVCPCNRIVRASRATIEEAPIVCGRCAQEFVAEGAGEEDADGVERAAAATGVGE